GRPATAPPAPAAPARSSGYGAPAARRRRADRRRAGRRRGAGRRIAWPWSIPDARVEQRIGAIDDQIDEDVYEGEEQRQALYDGVVARQHGFDHQPSQPGDIEHRFGDHHAADQQRDAHAHHGGDRHGGVAQRVPQQDAGFAEPLGARGADEVLAHDLDDAGARDAGDQRHIDGGQRQGRQDQAVQERPEAARQRRVALHLEPVQLDGEGPDEHVGGDEDRHREAQHREAHHQAVEQAPLAPRGQDAERNGDDQREQQRQRRQAERGFETLAYQLADRHPGHERGADVALQQPAGPQEELLHQRLVQAHDLADLGDALRR